MVSLAELDSLDPMVLLGLLLSAKGYYDSANEKQLEILSKRGVKKMNKRKKKGLENQTENEEKWEI